MVDLASPDRRSVPDPRNVTTPAGARLSDFSSSRGQRPAVTAFAQVSARSAATVLRRRSRSAIASGIKTPVSRHSPDNDPTMKNPAKRPRSWDWPLSSDFRLVAGCGPALSCRHRDDFGAVDRAGGGAAEGDRRVHRALGPARASLINERKLNRRAAHPCFARYVGVDYYGAETPRSSLPGLRVYMAEGEWAADRSPASAVASKALDPSRRLQRRPARDREQHLVGLPLVDEVLRLL